MAYSLEEQNEFHKKIEARRVELNSLDYLSEETRKILIDKTYSLEKQYEKNKIIYLNGKIRSLRINAQYENPGFERLNQKFKEQSKSASKNILNSLMNLYDFKARFNDSKIKDYMLN